MRRTAVGTGAAFAAFALLAAGCAADHPAGSAAGSAQEPGGSTPARHATAADPDAIIPGQAAPGDEAVAATPNPALPSRDSSKVTAFTVRGHTSHVDVRTLPQLPPVKRERIEPPRPVKVTGSSTGTPTGGAQTNSPTGTAPPLLVNVNGLDYAHWGAGHPPDTSGAVGPNQFVQTVNTSIGIFSKSTGSRLAAFTFDSFWQNKTGTDCDNSNYGDPQVVFDQPSGKWIIVDFAINGPYYECIAVSAGPDALNTSWTYYAFVASKNELNDYDKIGSWNDGIYMTANMFLNGNSFDGARVWAFQRSSLGSSALKVQSVSTGTSYGSLLPANAYQQVPAGRPEYFLALGNTNLQLWKMKVDWSDPSGTTFSRTPTLIPINGYSPANSVPELGGNSLDSLSDRLMYQLQFQAGTLWVNHSVQVNGRAGVRWYQVSKLQGTPKVKQQNTFAPRARGLSRWMGSLAVDKTGDMAVGYSTSSTTTHPGIRYATRTGTDPRGTLTAEGQIMQGNGSQTGYSRWGDYSQMSIDPTDGCTFWYTQEYYAATGTDWQTRIASFKFPGCS